MTGSDIVRHRDMYQKLFITMIDYMNMGLGPEDAVQRNPFRLHLRRPPEHDDRLRAGLRVCVRRGPLATMCRPRYPGRVVTLTFTSWNQIAPFLRRIDQLRSAA